MSFLSKLLGQDSADTLSVPAMDGMFKPNTLLDGTERIADLAGADNLAAGPDGLYTSGGNTLFHIDPDVKRVEAFRTFESTVTMAATSPAGRLAVGIEGGSLELFDNGAWRRLDFPADLAACITAGLFVDEETLYLTVGSRQHRASEWKRDLMSRGSTGTLLRCSLPTGAVEALADNLAFPYGLALLDDGRLAVSESWCHRVVAAQPRRGSTEVLIGDLPAYPARLATSAKGGFWLALFAPRRQLTEFVLSEDDYRLEMMSTISPEAWIGPDFCDNGDNEQPLQAGSVRQMGIMKPWAPSRSYGLVAKLDRDMKPVASYHSRADGRMHGIASVAKYRGQVYAASRGSGTLLRIGMDDAP
ncbi:MAG: hypothetical protein J0H31_25250 [Alphaproteobacteria bacterium]|nr:hypothetical protein [Alphaproteobacteria bacterium]